MMSSYSMGRVAEPGENFELESIFASLSLIQNNVLNRGCWTSRAQLSTAIITWTEGTYHQRRRQRVLGKLALIELEAINHSANAAQQLEP